MQHRCRSVLAAGALAGGVLIGGCGSQVGMHPDQATWELVSPDDVSPDSTRLQVGVERASCAGGVTGTVLEPQVTYEPDRVVIRTSVEPLPDGPYSCPGSNVVQLTVDLSEPVGNRELIDGVCLEADAVPSRECGNDGVRWSLGIPSAAAAWQLGKGSDVSPSSTTLRVGVVRLACSGGVTGTVLEPKITYEPDRILIQTDVAALPEGGCDCPGNDVVPIIVKLAEPVGDRQLVDLACLAGKAAATTFCTDDGVRWQL